MGKGTRGSQKKTISQYGDPAYDASTNLAQQSSGIMYGSPSNQSSGQARQRSPSPQNQQASPQQGNYQQNFEQLFPTGQLSLQDLEGKKSELSAMGMELIYSADGLSADILLPDGSHIDVMQGAKLGGMRPQQWDIEQPGGGQAAQGARGQGGVAGQALTDYSEILDRYRGFADTGGFSPQDLGAIRSRALSPVRAVYSDANRAIDRGRSLAGGYSPNYGAVKAKAAREQAYTTADATTNVEASIAQMVQQGKLAGMGGMSGIYGTTPGLANMFGQQALQAQGLQNQMGMGMIGASQQANQLPNAWDSTVGRIGQIGSAVFPWLNPVGSAMGAVSGGLNRPEMSDIYG